MENTRQRLARRLRLAATTLPLLLVLAALAPLSAPRVVAQAGAQRSWDAWVGTYRNRARDGGAAAIASAVDAGIGAMGPVMERIARRRILAANPPFQTLRIDYSGGELSVDFVGARRYRAPVSGARRGNRGPDGSDVQVSYSLQRGRLRERLDASEGFSTNIYRLSEDGSTLSLRSTMESDRLPAPITFTLRFRRQP